VGAAPEARLRHRHGNLPRCQGPLKIISCIDAPAVIQKILTHLHEKATALDAGYFPECRAPPRYAM
jgi:hypothetical protein